MKDHRLKNGATILTTSRHAFKFSDGTESVPQDDDVVTMLTLARTQRFVRITQTGMALNEVRMTLSTEQLHWLSCVACRYELVLIPLPVLLALREQGVRDDYPNCVAFNATTETQRASPQDKIVDINNWSY